MVHDEVVYAIVIAPSVSPRSVDTDLSKALPCVLFTRWIDGPMRPQLFFGRVECLVAVVVGGEKREGEGDVQCPSRPPPKEKRGKGKTARFGPTSPLSMAVSANESAYTHVIWRIFALSGISAHSFARLLLFS
jgi:hypothetical protein